MDPVNILAKFEVRIFAVHEVIATGILGGGCEPSV